jgi:hypothetical protein
MSESTVATFNAGASMLGYLYQVRVALLWAIRRSRAGDFSVSVETLDDVSFESNGDPIAVLQTKHSLHGTSGLSDLSPDLWKTLRIWMVGRRGIRSGPSAGRTPSPWPVSDQRIRCRTRPRRCDTYPGGLPAAARAAASSVGLKNETG